MVNGLRGLANLGNTCYINSILQILSHTEELSLSTLSVNSNVNEENFRVLWVNLKQMLWDDKNEIVIPKNFIIYLHRYAHHKKLDNFNRYQQNDSHEFLLFLIYVFHKSLCKKIHNVPTHKDKIMNIYNKTIHSNFNNEYSDIIPLFYGVHINFIIDLEGNVLSRKPEPFSIISTHINNVNSVYDCIVNYCKPDILNGNNSYVHPVSKNKIIVTKRIHILKTPPILIIHLNRWNEKGKKVNSMVHADRTMDISDIVIGNSTYKYSLYGVCNHSGTEHGGHYTSNIYTSGKWYNCNDTTISPIRAETVVTPYSYCFFYRLL